jgi:hypothetical protein
MRINPILVFSFLVALGGYPVSSQAAVASSPSAPSPDDVARPAGPPEGLPEIGKWMIAPDGSIASWLGWKYRGKGLREPVNVIIFDGIAKTGDEAYARLEAAAGDVEFEMRIGHSTGYDGLIGGTSFEQLPQGKGKAISDGPFELANNHGRIFGPFPWKTGWLFTAAFSRERVDIVTKVKHHFESFNRARDAFAWALDGGGRYRVELFVPLDNAIIGSTDICTGDHDGLAVYVAAVK